MGEKRFYSFDGNVLALALSSTRERAELLDYGLEERRGQQRGELAVRGGVGDRQRACVGVDRGLIQSRLFERRTRSLPHDRDALHQGGAVAAVMVSDMTTAMSNFTPFWKSIV